MTDGTAETTGTGAGGVALSGRGALSGRMKDGMREIRWKKVGHGPENIQFRSQDPLCHSDNLQLRSQQPISQPENLSHPQSRS